MFKEFNAHPKGIKTTDCVVRGISTATNSDYLEVRRELNRKKKEVVSRKLWTFFKTGNIEFLCI